MRTPAGTECPYFYGDYFRGRSLEECRLLSASGQKWSADLCKTCPVPRIGRANACEYLQLRATVARPLSAAFQRRVQVSAHCTRTNRAVTEPEIGCGECHPIPEVFHVN
jgi:hypothetical protein